MDEWGMGNGTGCGHVKGGATWESAGDERRGKGEWEPCALADHNGSDLVALQC
jgi:hypothetical protein